MLINVRNMIDQYNGDSEVAFRQLYHAIRSHQELGGRVRLWRDGKPLDVRLTAENRLVDAQGLPYGLLLLAMPLPGRKSGVELYTV